jgi:hypothetical protein
LQIEGLDVVRRRPQWVGCAQRGYGALQQCRRGAADVRPQPVDGVEPVGQVLVRIG